MAINLVNYVNVANRIHQQTTRLMVLAPSDHYDWKPYESSMTLGKLMNHMMLGQWAIGEAALTGVFPREEMKEFDNTAELIAAFDKQHEAIMARFAALATEQLDEFIQPFGPDKRRPRHELMGILLEHETHHRGQLYVYLRMLGCQVPSLFGG
jgi:uncharacterized damage-inducible protein DinB